MPKAAFISHASEDEAVAETITTYLERNGASCWFAPRDVRPGAEYASEIIDGIETSASLVLVLSENANTSEFVKREVERAVSKGKPVFPVRVREVTPSKSLELFISSAEWIDAWHPPLERYLGRLAESIKAVAASKEAPAQQTSTAGWHPDRAAAVPPPDAASLSKNAFRNPVTIGLAVAVVLLAALLVRNMFRNPAESPAPITTRPAGFDPPLPAAAAAVPAADAAPAAVTLASGGGAGSAAAAGGISPTDPCPRSLGVTRELPTPFTCSCSGQATSDGTVWGTDAYTDDSGLCRAALHAGVISPQGGSITVNRTAGRPLYVGSVRNGVLSHDYAVSEATIEFQGSTPQPPGPGLCPGSLGINRDLPTPFTCRCTSEAVAKGTVWGTDVYTDDSSLCRSALHAGKLTTDGGTITALRADGRQLYVGTTRNGVLSHDFPAFPSSVRFQ